MYSKVVDFSKSTFSRSNVMSVPGKFKKTVTTIYDVTKRAVTYATPGIFFGTAVILILSPVVGGTMLVDASALLTFLVFMLALGFTVVAIEALLLRSLVETAGASTDTTVA